jgi:hypothetical protein
LPLNTISMGQTTNQKPTGSGQDWAPVGPVGGDHQPRWSPSFAQPRVSAVRIWFCLAQPGRARILPAAGTLSGVVGLTHPFAGVGPSSIPGVPSRWGGPLSLHPVKRVPGGSMPGSCAGDGGCSGGRQRLSIGLMRAKAGR